MIGGGGGIPSASQWSLGGGGGPGGCPGLPPLSCPHGHASYPPPALMGGGGGGGGLMGNGGLGMLTSLGPSASSSFHGPPPLPPLTCNPCPTATNSNNFNSVPLPGPSRWGPRTSCPVHSPFRARLPNGGGSICSGHQVNID